MIRVVLLVLAAFVLILGLVVLAGSCAVGGASPDSPGIGVDIDMPGKHKTKRGRR